MAGAMQTRRLGASTLEILPVAFGAWAIGGWWWGKSDDSEAVSALETWIERGGIGIDTAPIYGFGRSERLVGRALSGRKDRAVVMTKAGLVWEREEGKLAFETKGDDGRTVRVFRNSRPDSLAREVDASLTRLGVERIDLLQIHWPDETTPIEDSMGALLELKRQGKLAWIGVSNFTPALLERARRALEPEPLVSTQERYSLIDRRVERGALAWAREAACGFLAYSPLEQGLLTGKLTPERVLESGDLRNQHQKFAPASRARVIEVLERHVLPIAARHKASAAQVALAWVCTRPGVTCALAGARSRAQALENLAAASVALEAGEMSELDRAFAGFDPQRGRPGALRALARKLFVR